MNIWLLWSLNKKIPAVDLFRVIIDKKVAEGTCVRSFGWDITGVLSADRISPSAPLDLFLASEAFFELPVLDGHSC